MASTLKEDVKEVENTVEGLLLDLCKKYGAKGLSLDTKTHLCTLGGGPEVDAIIVTVTLKV